MEAICTVEGEQPCLSSMLSSTSCVYCTAASQLGLDCIARTVLYSCTVGRSIVRRKRLSKRSEARIGTEYELWEDTRAKNGNEKQIIVRLSTRDRSCPLFPHCTTHVRNMQYTQKQDNVAFLPSLKTCKQ
jgi:hypothetical protein